MGGGGPSTTTTVQKNDLDPMVRQWTAQNYAKAQQIANTPYHPYTGQMVAPLTPLQNQGINLGSHAAGANLGMGALNAGVTNAEQAGDYHPISVGTGTFNTAAARQYMSPYTQSVIDAADAEIDRNLAQTQNATDAQAVTAGAYGGTRQAVANAENTRNANQLKAQTTAGLLDQAYTNAQGAFQTDQERKLQAEEANQQAGLNAANLGLGSADLLGRLGVAQQGVAQGNAQALLGYGQIQQDQQNAINEFNYENNYLNPQQWPLRGLSAMESAVSGIPFSSSASSSTPVYHNRTAGALGGAASGAAMGSYFGPWGTAIGAVAGGLMGAFG